MTEPAGTIPQWQKEHRARLKAQGIEVPDESPEDPPIHCRRCHRDIPSADHPKHYRECPGFSSACETVACPASPEAKLPADGHTSSESSA